MNDGILTWGAIIGGLGGIIAVAKMWMDLGSTRQKAKDAGDSATEAHARLDSLIGNSASKSELATAERRFADAVNGLRNDFSGMSTRLDNLLSHLIKRPD